MRHTHTRSLLLQVVKNQQNRDDAIQDLVETMTKTLEFVNQTEDLTKRYNDYDVRISKLLSQVVECAYFIREYTKDLSFGVSNGLLPRASFS